MRTIFRYITPKAPRIAVGLSIKFIGTIVELLLPWMLSIILDEHVPAKDMPKIYLWGGLMVLCALVCLIANITANRMACKTSRDITRNIRRDLFNKVTSLTCAEADHFTTPSLISRLTTDTYNLHQMYDRMQRLGIRAPILLIGGIVVTFTLDAKLTLVLIATMPFLCAIVWTVTGKGVKLYSKAQVKQDKMVRRAKESMAGIRVIQALSKIDYEQDQFDEANTEVVQCDKQASMLMNITNPVMNLILNVGQTAVIVVGAFLVNSGELQSGTLIAFLSYFTIILNALMTISRIFMICSKGTASGRRVAEVLNTPAEMKLHDIPAKESENHIEFDHVTFSYDKVQPNVTDIHFALKQGETLGIIGPTGAGKSTILQLLLRFYDPDEGSIRIGGRDVRSISADELHSMFGIAMQNDFLFAGTIGENIDFKRDLQREQWYKAAEIAQAEFIDTRKDSYDGSIASKGSDLSGGQKQRLLLTRAFADDPSILLLDDSSSALDYKTDAKLRRAMTEQHFDATKIIVAQRISSIRHANLIMVIDDGKVLGLGTHEQLIKTCTPYREISRAQMGEEDQNA